MFWGVPLLEACLDARAVTLHPSIQNALDALEDAVVCRATDGSQATYGGVSIFFPCRSGDLDAYPGALASASSNPAGPLAEWRRYASSLVAPGCALPTQLTWLKSPGLVVPAAAPSTPLGLASDIEVAADLTGPTTRLVAAWFSVRDKDSQRVLLEIPLDRTAVATTGKLRHTWRGRSAAFLEGSPAPALLRLASTYTTGPGSVLQADQTALRWLVGEGEGAMAIEVLALALLTIPETSELPAPGTLRDVRSFGRRGSVPTSLPAGLPVQTGFGSTTIVSDPPRVVWGPIPRTLQVEVGFRCVDRLGGQISGFTWWDTRKF